MAQWDGIFIETLLCHVERNPSGGDIYLIRKKCPYFTDEALII
jgi:hypothetical protein